MKPELRIPNSRDLQLTSTSHLGLSGIFHSVILNRKACRSSCQYAGQAEEVASRLSAEGTSLPEFRDCAHSAEGKDLADRFGNDAMLHNLNERIELMDKDKVA
jgi:hypothetical protein